MPYDIITLQSQISIMQTFSIYLLLTVLLEFIGEYEAFRDTLNECENFAFVIGMTFDLTCSCRVGLTWALLPQHVI